MEYILKSRLKIYTKEFLKLFKYAIILIILIVSIITLKYKPVYEVEIENKNIGYVKSKNEFERKLKENINKNKDKNKNIYDIEIIKEPKYKLKLLSKKEKTQEDKVLIEIQKDLKIRYQYYDIYLNGSKIDSVDTLEETEKIKNEEKIKKESIEIKQQITENPDDIKTNNLEVAKKNIFNKLNIIEENRKLDEKRTINGIKLAQIPVQGTITSRYGEKSRLRKAEHTGLDIASRKGTPIKVTASGVVTCAQAKGAYGNLVKIDHGNGVETWYGHTDKMYVKEGQEVKEGQIIASVGSTGNSTGPHLHFEIRINGKHVNPQNYLY